MHAAAPPTQPVSAVHCAPEPLPTKIERLHTEALDALRLVMTKALDSITTLPPPALSDEGADEPAQSPADHARTVTQRMRLALTAARDLLRYTHGGAERGGDPPTRPWRKPGLAATPEAQTAQASARASSHTDIDQAASTLLAAARPVLSGAERTKAGSDVATQSVSPISRFGERIDSPVDAPQAPNPTDPTPATNDTAASSPPPRDSSLVAHTCPPASDSALTTHDSALPSPSPLPPRLTPTYPPVPLRPNWGCKGPVTVPACFTDDEIDLFEATLRTPDPFPKPLYLRLREWRNHCIHYYLPFPLPISLDQILERSPFKAKPAQQAPAVEGRPRAP